MTPTCAKCGNRSFSLTEETVSNANFRQFFIHCAKCGAPVAVTGLHEPGALLKKQEAEIKKLEQKLARVDQAVQQILHAVSRR
jgi:hypothetical protein